MRMKKLLMFLVLLSVSLGMRAADISGTGISGATDNSSGKKVQTLVINTPGALAQWVANHTGDKYDTNNPFEGLGGSDDFYSLKISGELNAADLAALNSTTCAAFSRFPRIDMSEVTLAEETTSKDVCSVVFGPASFQKNNETITGNGATFIRLPKSMTSAEDVAEMAKMKNDGKNSNLKMVGAYDPDNEDMSDSSKKWAEVAIHSFEANKVSSFLETMNIPVYQNPDPQPRRIWLSGEYGDRDLVDGDRPNFGYENSAEWDFTGAHFADITIPASTAKYHKYDNPFCEPDVLVAPSTSSNAFYYFKQYATRVVSLKLPDKNMTHLPKGILYEMAKMNEDGYKALYGTAAFNDNRETNEGVPIETFVIPDCYTDIDEGAAELARIRHLYVGSGMKRIHGGAFLGCPYLEDLDFAAGLSDCYLGDQAFNECESMKHIALSEGIVSLGNGCFWNSQHLESIRLPQSLLYMGNHCFDNCLALNSITIPENVEKIGQAAFNLCPFTDIYLTTTDPAKIPYVWSAGTNFLAFDGNCTFHHGHVDGWEGGIDGDKDKIDGKMTWEEAAEFYFTHWNGMPVLHFPKELAEKVRSEISAQYALKTKVEDGKQYGLPMRVDMDRRDDIPGADLGSSGAGKYTQDGWAQFMMMKEFTTKPGGDVYPKYYEDVWYTMCFPFDLTDEQLAAAFNETFNIVDFSGVEVMEKDDPKNETGNLTLTLHFNTVAKTYYRDSEGNEYNVVGREVDPTSKFSYNIYERDGKQYHHSQVSAQLSSNKTKTFAEGNSIEAANANKDNAFIIDGYLATAGHPYMIHPAIGTSFGNPKRCDFSGVVWKPQTQWANIFEAQKREVDLGVPKGSFEEDADIHDHSKWTPDDDNYMQPKYSKYAGQKYTFIGNPEEFDAEAVATYELEDEPQVPEKPVPAVKPTAEEIEALKPGETLNQPVGPENGNPETNTKYSDEFKELFTTVRCSYTGWNAEAGKQDYLYQYTFGEDLIAYDWSEFFTKQDWVDGKYGPYYLYNNNRSNGHNVNYDNNNVVTWNLDALEDYLGEGPFTSLDGFNTLKQLAVDYQTDKAAWATYQSDLAAYITNRAEWAYYNAQKEIYDNWNQTAKDQEYQDALNYYNSQTDAHKAWVTKSKKYQRLIPTGAYFLGRKSDPNGNPIEYPRYYREIADDQRAFENRNGGYWSQFTAVIIPNDAAINGIEKQLGPGIANNTKALNMVFDEGFMGEFDPTEIKDIVAEAEEKGQKVEYMNIVYSINGEIVGRGSQSLSNLPQGMYIINGKKYLVK